MLCKALNKIKLIGSLASGLKTQIIVTCSMFNDQEFENVVKNLKLRDEYLKGKAILQEVGRIFNINTLIYLLVNLYCQFMTWGRTNTVLAN